MRVIEFDEQCKSCGGTGLYVGLAEQDGAAVVCHTCQGTGCHNFRHEYEEFTGRKDRPGIKRVFQCNPGICIGVGKERKYALSDFGGIPFDKWRDGGGFEPGTENRAFTCPAWWYQSADYKKKPRWHECRWGGCFSGCLHFCHKEVCWARWDRENKQEDNR